MENKCYFCKLKDCTYGDKKLKCNFIDRIFDFLQENKMDIDEFCGILKGIKDAREGKFVIL